MKNPEVVSEEVDFIAYCACIPNKTFKYIHQCTSNLCFLMINNLMIYFEFVSINIIPLVYILMLYVLLYERNVKLNQNYQLSMLRNLSTP